jgi:hypothetical protein
VPLGAFGAARHAGQTVNAPAQMTERRGYCKVGLSARARRRRRSLQRAAVGAPGKLLYLMILTFVGGAGATLVLGGALPFAAL